MDDNKNVKEAIKEIIEEILEKHEQLFGKLREAEIMEQVKKTFPGN